MSRSVLFCAWCGPVFVIIFLLGLLVAGLIPLPAPNLSAQGLAAEILGDDRTRLRTGLLIALAATGLYGFFSAGISVHLKRIEGRDSPMTYAQLGLGVLVVLLLIFPLMGLMVAAYRPERDSELIRLLIDSSLFPVIGAWMTVVCQWVACAIAIFQDDCADPVFPRWAGYLNLWCAVSSLPSSLLFFVHDGPFAWNGLFSFWLALSAFGAWIVVMSVLVIRSGRRPAT
jgi:hypothetical protein